MTKKKSLIKTTKEFEQHMDSLNEKTKDAMSMILRLHTKNNYPIMNDINDMCTDLLIKGYDKVTISLTGKNNLGQELQHDHKITINVVTGHRA